MSDPSRYDAIHQIELLIQELHYTMDYSGGLVTIHVPGEGDQTFFLNGEQGMHATRHILQWLEGRKNVMSQFEQIPASVKQQYINLYGEYVPGEYPIGSKVKAPGVQGEVIWSFRPGGNGMHSYVIAPSGGFPVEVLASDLQSEVERN